MQHTESTKNKSTSTSTHVKCIVGDGGNVVELEDAGTFSSDADDASHHSVSYIPAAVCDLLLVSSVFCAAPPAHPGKPGKHTATRCSL